MSLLRTTCIYPQIIFKGIAIYIIFKNISKMNHQHADDCKNLPGKFISVVQPKLVNLSVNFANEYLHNKLSNEITFSDL